MSRRSGVRAETDPQRPASATHVEYLPSTCITGWFLQNCRQNNDLAGHLEYEEPPNSQPVTGEYAYSTPTASGLNYMPVL